MSSLAKKNNQIGKVKMAKLTWKTRSKGTVQTTIGELKVEVKKPFKGSLNYAVFVDGRHTYYLGSTLDEARTKAEKYVKTWK